MSSPNSSTKRRRILNKLADIAAINSEESESLDLELVEDEDIVLPLVQNQSQLHEGTTYILYIITSARIGGTRGN